MSKVGRNDPCPCGSGKKFKKCCYGKSNVSEISSATTAAMGFQQAQAMAQQMLGLAGGDGSTNSEDSRPLLVLERWAVEDPAALDKVKSLGKLSDETVLFHKGKQWVAEIDFSLQTELLVSTPTESEANRIKALLSQIEGLKRLERRTEEFDQFEEGDAGSRGAGLLDFKKQFFLEWVDIVNEKLDGMTPREASKSASHRKALERLLAELEKKEKKLPKKDRFSFAKVRQILGL